MRIYFKYLFNFFDQIPIELVKSGKEGHNSSFELNSAFLFTLRIFDLLIIYSFYYLFYKSVQFIIALLLKNDISEISLAILVVPILLLLEIGVSSLNSAKIKYLTLFAIRAIFKYLAILLLDILIINIFINIS